MSDTFGSTFDLFFGAKEDEADGMAVREIAGESKVVVTDRDAYDTWVAESAANTAAEQAELGKRLAMDEWEE